MRSAEQVQRLLSFAGIVPDSSPLEPTKDEVFYNVVLDKALADMRSPAVDVRKTSARTVAAFAEHIRKRKDVIEVLESLVDDGDKEVARNARKTLDRVTKCSGGPSIIEFQDFLWPESEVRLAAATDRKSEEVTRISGEGAEEVSATLRETSTGDVELIVVCDRCRRGHVHVTVGETVMPPVDLRAVRGDKRVAELWLYRAEHVIQGKPQISIKVEFER